MQANLGSVAMPNKSIRKWLKSIWTVHGELYKWPQKHTECREQPQIHQQPSHKLHPLTPSANANDATNDAAVY